MKKILSGLLVLSAILSSMAYAHPVKRPVEVRVVKKVVRVIHPRPRPVKKIIVEKKVVNNRF